MNERRPADRLAIDVGKDALPRHRASERPVAIAGCCIHDIWVQRRAVPAVSDGDSTKLQGLVDLASSVAHTRGSRGVKVNASIAERSLGHKVKKDLGVLKPLNGMRAMMS